MLQPPRNLNLRTACDDALARFVADNPLSGVEFERACALLPGGNTRTVLHYDPYPLTMRNGTGARLTDIDGHEYVDFLGEYSAGLYGHSDPVIRSAIDAALADGLVRCAPGRHEAMLAAIMCERFSSCEKIRFCNSGTEANLMALSAARVATGRSHIMAFDGAYHGGVLYFVHGADPINVPYPVVMGAYNDIDVTLQRIEAHADRLAAIIVEPMLGAGGAIPGDASFLTALREACSDHGIVLIFDEVMTSRISPGGLQGVVSVRPDLTTFGKYIGGGLSYGAFGGRDSIMCQFDPRHAEASPHAGTFNNNPLTMAAGLAGLTGCYTEEVADRHTALGDRFRAQLNAVASKLGVPVQVTGSGTIMCIHFQTEPIGRPADVGAVDPMLRVLFHLEMLRRGFYLAQRGYMSLSLPLTDRDLTDFVIAFEEVLASNASIFE
ncbi:MAG: aspartate aminotransferase family protein [Gammaproteobacteria bacterium]|nr:aspartate aminotransferase family protein [Gammaproteobacteria bacterium]MDH3465111.1 aspartate aminotransferase family protein [Gammaproteobacteria bacterium]